MDRNKRESNPSCAGPEHDPPNSEKPGSPRAAAAATISPAENILTLNPGDSHTETINVVVLPPVGNDIGYVNVNLVAHGDTAPFVVSITPPVATRFGARNVVGKYVKAVPRLAGVLVLLWAGATFGSAGTLNDGLSREDNSLLKKLASQFEEPLVRTGTSPAEEDKALLEALKSHRDRAGLDDFRSIRAFVSDYPRSGWRIALLTNLGLSYYRDGYFSKAIQTWEDAWAGGKSLVAPPEGKAVVDRAVGELARLHARLGHADELKVLLDEIENRPVSGPATEAVTGANEGLWMMRNKPGVAYLCGPMALKNLLLEQKADARADSIYPQRSLRPARDELGRSCSFGLKGWAKS